MSNLPRPARYVGVIGIGRSEPETDALAYAVGTRLAQAGAVVVCGGLGGVMAAACKGARAAGGLTIGLLPGTERSEANPDVTVSIATGLGYARNYAIVNTADALIAIGGEYGTLSEIGFALKAGKPVIGLRTHVVPDVVKVETAEQAVELAIKYGAARVP
jgi:uncharacterized protein (TIGR00725 family)